MLRIFVRNIISNWIGFAVQVIVVFLLTPFVLHYLGDARYGIWSLVVGLTGYYGLLDLGFRSGIIQYMTRHLAKSDYEQINRTASTAFVALACCAGCVAIAASILSWIAPHVFTLPSDAVSETRFCIIVVGCSAALQFLFYPFSAVFTATQRFDLSNIIGISTRIASAVATYAALRQGYSLVGLSVINATGDLVGYLLRWRLAYRLLPQLAISVNLAAWENLWPITTFGIWSTLILGAQQLNSYTNTLLIGLFLSVSAVAPFSIVISLLDYFTNFFQPISVVFLPAATHFDARGDADGLRKIYFAGSRMMLCMAAIAGIAGITWVADFYRLWIGQKMVEGGNYSYVVTIFDILIIGTIATSAQRIGYQVLVGSRRIKRLALLLVCQGALNLVLSLCLIQRFGLVGVALGIAIPAVIFQAFVHPLVVCRSIHVPVSRYLAEVYPRPLLVAALYAAVLAATRHWTAPATTWLNLFVYGLFAGSVASVFMCAVGLNRNERQRLLFAPVARLVNYVWSGKTPGGLKDCSNSIATSESHRS
jgi:O-antigen/teichoic acid export membrane protein